MQGSNSISLCSSVSATHFADDHCERGSSPETYGKVLLLRNLPRGLTEVDLQFLVQDWVEDFQPKIFLQTLIGHAFIEMQTEKQMEEIVNYYQRYPLQMKGITVQVMISKRHSVELPDDDEEPFRVVLSSITNMVYPVDVDLVHFVFSKYGQIEKIISFVRSPSTLHILVQFKYPKDARNAVVNLHNQNIYDGCNTLQVQRSRQVEITVRQNNEKQWDYTMDPRGYRLHMTESVSQTNRSEQMSHDVARSGSIESMRRIRGKNVNGRREVANAESRGTSSGESLTGDKLSTTDSSSYPSADARGSVHSPLARRLMCNLSKDLVDVDLSSLNPHHAAVIIVYDLSAEKIDTRKLFNLFSLAGMVTRIKILRDRSNTALIQFNDPIFASLAVYFFQNIPFYDASNPIRIGFSRNSEITLPTKQKQDEDASRKNSYFDMTEQRNSIDEAENFLRSVCCPTDLIFISNICQEVPEEELINLVLQFAKVSDVTWRPPRVGSTKKSCFIRTVSVADAVSLLTNLHNHVLCNVKLKIAFSKARL